MAEMAPSEGQEVKTESLEDLGIKLVEQTSLENQIQTDANKTIIIKEREADLKRLEKTKQKLVKVQHELKKLSLRLEDPRTRISQKEEIKKHIVLLKKEQLIPTEQDIIDIQERLNDNQLRSQDITLAGAGGENGRLPNESEKDFLIRTGKITAFGNTSHFKIEENKDYDEVVSHQNLRIPGFMDDVDADAEEEQLENEHNDESKYRRILSEDETRNTDDGIEEFYQNRLYTWCHRRQALRKDMKETDSEAGKPEWFKKHPTLPDAVLDNDFRVPGDIYPSLFDYQKTGVQWLYELYCQKHGGIISDEMGLGKTIQIIAFLAGLHYSGKLEKKPVLIVCPTTVMTQWVNEFHVWWPPLRTILLHSIGSGMSAAETNKNQEDKLDELLEKEIDDDYDVNNDQFNSLKSKNNIERILNTILNEGHILITSYVGLKIYEDYLSDVKWGYVVLDEGHKIKNPNSNVTIAAKRLKTSNRIILSGTPIQNNLIELWSLFDFIYPGRLGTLPIFQDEFEIPIKIGGYANASNLDVKIGYQKAVLLKELIQPFLLRRVKADVARDLPSKQEYVLMCRLTKYQKDKYIEFLNTLELKINSYLGAIDSLRKICNHPDLLDVKYKSNELNYGDPSRSGKLQVLKSILKTWNEEGHKILLFTQTKQMMKILEKFLNNTFPQFNYLQMSGTTDIGRRQEMIYKFNNEPYDLFLLTTKVGGLGVNLTGADRVIIFDPDWNPSTDLQARERAWRLGQKKDVLIYRLIIGGSIEEKIYHRQIFKQLLTDKILKDPNQKRYFKNNELHDLFTLSDFNDNSNDLLKVKSSAANKNHKTEENDDLNKLASIQGVSKLEVFKDQEEPKDEGDRLMNGLFSKPIKHDDVISRHSKPNESLLDKEAKKAAMIALNKLKESKKQVKKSGVGVPTFTGKFGLAGKLKLKPSAASNKISKAPISSSANILSNLKKQKERLNDDTIGDDRDVKLIQNIKQYLLNKPNNFSKSNEIINDLNINIKERKDLTFIRSILKGICKWDSNQQGWVLKEEFVN